jgi:hypothetical protein
MPARVDLPLIRRDHTPIETPTIGRASTWSFVDQSGNRHTNPVTTNQPLTTLTDAKPETVC